MKSLLLYRLNEATVRVLTSAISKSARHGYEQKERLECRKGRVSKGQLNEYGTQFPLPFSSFHPIFSTHGVISFNQNDTLIAIWKPQVLKPREIG